MTGMRLPTPRLQPAQLDVAGVVAHRVADQLCRLGLSLRLDDGGLLLLLGLVDDKLCSLRLLLRNLLRLDRRGVLLAKGEVRDRDVVEHEVKLARAGEQVRPDPLRDGLPNIKRCRSRRCQRTAAAVPVYHRCTAWLSAA